MSDTTDTSDFSSPYRLAPDAWTALVTELGADKLVTKKARTRTPRKPGATSSPASEYSQDGGRSAWEIALELAGRLGRELGDGKLAVWCINDAQHSNPDGSAEAAGGSCVLLPPAQDSIFGLPKCSHGHCQKLTLRQWIAAVGFDNWAEAMLRARGWRRAREFLLHDDGISGWKSAPFLLRDHEDTVEGGPYQVVPDDTEYCDFAARIVSDVEEHEVLTSRRYYEIAARVGERTRTFRVPASEFASLGWVPGQLGPDAVIAPGRDTLTKLRAAIQYLSKPVERRDAYTFVGWRKIADRWAYLHAGGAISGDGAVEGITMALRNDVLPRFELPKPPEGEALTKAVFAAAELFGICSPSVTVPLFGSVWRAPLGPSPLTVYLAAPTSTGKSLLAALAQQHFGAVMDEARLPSSVKHSTAASVNELRVLVGDAIFTYDDFRLSGSSSEDLRFGERLDTVVRAQYGGTGAQRLSRDGSLNSHGAPPRSLLLVTGETVPPGHSLRNRLLIVDVEKIARNLTPEKEQAAAGVYARAMAGYLRWIAPRLEEVRAEVRLLAKEYTVRFAEGGDPNNRTALLFAEVAVGMEYFARFAADVGAFKASDVTWFRELTWTTLRGLADRQAQHQAAEDPAKRFCGLIGAVLSAKRAHLTLTNGLAPEGAGLWGWAVGSATSVIEEGEEPEPDDMPEAEIPFDDVPPKPVKTDAELRKVAFRPMGDCLGFVDTKKRMIWLRVEVAHRVAREFGASAGTPLVLTAEDLPKRLFESGLLAATELEERRTYTVRKSVGKSSKGGYVCLKTSAVGIGEDA